MRDLLTLVVNLGKNQRICSAAAILETKLEMCAIPDCERTGYVGKHVPKWSQKGQNMFYFLSEK